MKKFLFLLLATAAFAACNDDDGSPKIRYASTNEGIVNGDLQGVNMHFYGVATVTEAQQNSTYTDNEAYFEFAGGSDHFSLYMHKTRFAAAMPPLEMMLPHTPYTGRGNSITFSQASIVPEVKLPGADGGYNYQPMPAYTLTEVKGSIDGVNCRVSFVCNVPRLGTYRVEYEGKLIIKE
ncbi:hypothetical protein [Alistipes sp.]|uniref:hypothetical protein n=1 Tax=Alistipes sp. TaxID=1872444 RepID=UPI0025C0D104|nr:hypothetical protein [Alistipes sp.]